VNESASHAGSDKAVIVLLWASTIAFALRVAAQATQFWIPQTFLPPFGEFQGSTLPYSILLSSQLAILAVMVATCFAMQREGLRRSAAWARFLSWAGSIYMAGSLARIFVGLAVPAAPEWFRAWISGVFHVVLAIFVLAAASYHRRSRR
jgi:hypothetical protein